MTARTTAARLLAELTAPDGARGEVAATLRLTAQVRRGRSDAPTVVATHVLVRGPAGGRVVALTELSSTGAVEVLEEAAWAPTVAALLATSGGAPPVGDAPAGLPPYVLLPQQALATGAAMVAAGRLDLLKPLLAGATAPVRAGDDARRAEPLDLAAAARLLRDLAADADGAAHAAVTCPGAGRSSIAGAHYLHWADGWRRLRPVRRDGPRLVELVRTPHAVHAALLVGATTDRTAPGAPR